MAKKSCFQIIYKGINFPKIDKERKIKILKIKFYKANINVLSNEQIINIEKQLSQVSKGESYVNKSKILAHFTY